MIFFGIFIERQLVIKKQQRIIIKRECGILSMIRHLEYITMIYDIKQHIKKSLTTGRGVLRPNFERLWWHRLMQSQSVNLFFIAFLSSENQFN